MQAILSAAPWIPPILLSAGAALMIGLAIAADRCAAALSRKWDARPQWRAEQLARTRPGWTPAFPPPPSNPFPCP